MSFRFAQGASRPCSVTPNATTAPLSQSRRASLAPAQARLPSWVGNVRVLDIQGLHRACVKLEATSGQELRGNCTPSNDALKLKPAGERGLGLGRRAHRVDAWNKLEQVLLNTFKPKQTGCWEARLFGKALADRRADYDARCTAADAFARQIVRDLRTHGPATPLRVQQVATVNEFVDRYGLAATREDWGRYRDEGAAVVRLHPMPSHAGLISNAT